MSDRDTWVFEYFSPSEFTCRCEGFCEHEDVVDRLLVAGLDTLRENLGVPLLVNSGHRCTEHNRNVGGSPTSRHLYGVAADIRLPLDMSSEELAREAEKIEAFEVGGIGLYNTFVHLDVRGRRVRWDNRTGE